MSTNQLPEKVTSLLKSSKFVHLATANPANCFPHVSLMNYTYVYDAANNKNLLIMASPKNTVKVENIKANPHVSLLIHDWSNSAATDASGAPCSDSNLLAMLKTLNERELVRVSITLTGQARLLANDDDERAAYQALLLKLNPEAKAFIEGDIELILIELKAAKVADTNNNVNEY
ncbi:hypothetical protein BABINDRAFT_36195 [Babjeviella inositovora NRRL Y-12698]|uniref:Pyridoxamine 5'-phosphate oxidase N-terminal domain-containing protein n=1 Tax=Babjeviella inositovora NRRL Y-12698 TaxID=984486 RepID=A0A1E3QQ97_9ASCO|nr:uncharacterized protein BABINDRAFT_36195 [Babjeviella inositovora NRRL Y-12698]ODQ79879.1 hypothetical protein BABINDRAFT_36195 [Babjeviella inositovora NRRL Y-12698]